MTTIRALPDLTDYLTDAIMERLGGTEVGIGPTPDGYADEWVDVEVTAAYQGTAPDLGDLVVTVPASEVGPARRFRVLLVEIHDGHDDLGEHTEADWAEYARGFAARAAVYAHADQDGS